MRFTTKILFIALMANFTVTAQKPVGVAGFIGNYLDYYQLQGGNPSGDTYYFSAWAANSMLPLFPDPTGLPIVGTQNDGSSGACSGNIELLQLSNLPAPFVTPTAANSLITAYPNCLSSFGTAPGAINVPAGWTGQLTSGDGRTDGTWKGTVMAFRNNILLAPVYRQTSAGDAFGDSTLILSPDAGQTWIDYGRYNTYAVTGASCSGTTVTLNAANALSAGQKIYVHDIVPSGYNGKATVTVVTSGTVQYTVGSCPANYTSGGAFGLLSSDGSAPPPTSTMWVGNGQMGVQSIVIYGQDGNYPVGIEPACDPTVYVCGVSFTKAMGHSSYPTYLYRVPLGQEMNKALYEWYSCPGYSTFWPIADTVCDGNRSSSWTGTIGDATVLVYTKRWGNGARPGECFGLRYLPSHGSYLMTCLQESYIYAGGRSAAYWAPHPWGPYYPLYNSESTGMAASLQSFLVGMPYQENIISTTPPSTQLRVSANVGPGHYTPGGNPVFGALDVISGKVTGAGISRWGDWLGEYGYIGMGHRLVSGNEADGISRRGKSANGVYSLDWWTDLWDHGGDAAATDRPYFRDLVTGGVRYLAARSNNGLTDFNRFGDNVSLRADGVYISGGEYNPRLQSTWSDTTLTGNASWTLVFVVKPTSDSSVGIFGTPNIDWSYNPTMVNVAAGVHAAGDLCVRWGPLNNHTDLCTAGSQIAANNWYFLAITAEAQTSGYPTIRMYLGNAGTIAEFGGVGMALSATGTSAGGLTKLCPVTCTATPAVTSNILYLGRLDQGTEAQLTGVFGEAGVYSGAVPSHVIREIYRTLRKDWARVGRGAL